MLKRRRPQPPGAAGTNRNTHMGDRGLRLAPRNTGQKPFQGPVGHLPTPGLKGAGRVPLQ